MYYSSFCFYEKINDFLPKDSPQPILKYSGFWYPRFSIMVNRSCVGGYSKFSGIVIYWTKVIIRVNRKSTTFLYAFSILQTI